MNIGENLKTIRLQQKLTQIEVANKLNISQQAWSHYEKGDRDINVNLLRKFCIMFEVSADEILDIDTPLGRSKI